MAVVETKITAVTQRKQSTKCDGYGYGYGYFDGYGYGCGDGDSDEKM